MSQGLVARDLEKRFNDTRALHGVSLVVPAGSIAAVTGSNGAGKTTLLRIFATLLRPDAGSAAVNDADVVRDGDAVRRAIGVALVNERALYWRLSGLDNLRFFARAAGLSRRDARRRAEEAAEAVGLTGIAARRVSGYSAGQRQRLTLARAIVASPSVLLVDEPMRGLDEPGIARVRALLAGHARDGGTVLVASPTLTDMDDLFDQIVELRDGAVADRRVRAAVGDR